MTTQGPLKRKRQWSPLTPSTTEFQKKVYEVTKSIPKGKVTTYGTIAKQLQTSSRAVGTALKKNPYAPAVPCHRVVKGDCHIGGFGGQMNAESTLKKMKLLSDEGVHFNGEYVSPECVVKSL
jgi:methylated-DNA-[protein]-cysteine S-methyltransferase